MSKNQSFTKLDAKNQALGRLAAKTAKLLIQNEPVEINNIEKIRQTFGKKVYWRHTGYPGGIKKKSYQEVGPREAFRKAVLGMLPKNKLQTIRIKKLKLNE